MANALSDQVEELRVELATQRLITRSIVMFLILKHDASVPGLVSTLMDLNERMSPGQASIDGLDPELHLKASRLLRIRTEQMLQNIGEFVVPLATRHPHRPAA